MTVEGDGSSGGAGLEDEEENEPLVKSSRSRSERLPRLSLGMRIVAFVVGWALLLVGVAGLALPGIQGILTLLAGTAVLSIVSETFYRLLRRLFGRWPGAWRRVRGFRQKVHGWLHKDDSPGPSDR